MKQFQEVKAQYYVLVSYTCNSLSLVIGQAAKKFDGMYNYFLFLLVLD